ncbi:hypothetical protein [Caulobacter sp. DWR1-3-2b1]|uniref:hypothetical protein n=1 Tax=Caulobacter sp. DWR1-3-2b1 TaxID=2804670 RepID=UPI003CF893D5
MSNIGLIFIVYNSYDDLDLLLESQSIIDIECFNIIVVDNTDVALRDTGRLERWSPYRNIHICYSGINEGYFGGARVALREHPELFDDADFVVISNVDLEFSFKDLILSLSNVEIRQSDVGVFAPTLVSESGLPVRQLHYYSRPSSRHYVRLSKIYGIYNLAVIHRIFFDLKRKIFPSRSSDEDRDLIFAPHGAMMIFTKRYMKETASFRHPAFLFCEEIFVGYQCAIANLSCRRLRDVTYSHRNHGSIGAIPSRKIVLFLLEAHLAATPMLATLERMESQALLKSTSR